MRQRIQLISIDHSITIALILFIVIVFSAFQLSAQEKKENNKIESPANIDNPNSTQSLNDKIEFKNGPSSSILTITDEGNNAGSITLPNVGSSRSGNKLYNNGGSLYWGNSMLEGSSSFIDDWDDDGSAVFMLNPSRNVGIGTVITETSTKLHVKGDEGVLFQGTFGNGTALSLGAGSRFQYYPKKAALRSGRVDGTQWDDTNIGINSAAFGRNTIASGDAATSSGFESEANGNSSIALGFRNISTGNRSMAIGSETNAKTFASFAIGRFNAGSGSNTAWVETDPLFEIGNGINSTSVSNALTVLKNGKVGIGIVNPSHNLHVKSESGENPLKVQIGNATKMSVFSNGGTSVGTAATPPTNGLLVSGTLKASTIIETNNLDSPSGNVSINDNLYVSDNNIGIGISNTTKKLEVNGDTKLNDTEIGSLKVGSSGTFISEIIKLTGTTNSSDDITVIDTPTGYNSQNSYILSCKVEQPSSTYNNTWDDTESWKFVGSDPNSTFVFQWTNSTLGVLRLNVGPNKFRGRPYEIIIMKID